MPLFWAYLRSRRRSDAAPVRNSRAGGALGNNPHQRIFNRLPEWSPRYLTGSPWVALR